MSDPAGQSPISSITSDSWVVLLTSLNELNARIFQTMDIPEVAIPDVVHHYTDTNGLIGIVDSNMLWATNAAYLNDEKEIEYAASVARSALETVLDDRGYDLTKDKNAAVAKLAVEHTLDAVHSAIGSYVVCFCRSGDLLSQWRGYGNVGGSFAIGFDAKALGQRFSQTNPPFRLVKVEYDPARQIQLIQWIVEQWFDFVISNNVCNIPPAGTPEKRVSAEVLMQSVFPLLFGNIAASLKHPSFVEEDEYRLLYNIFRYRNEQETSLLPLKFRNKGGLVVPYVEFAQRDEEYAMIRLPISSIRSGPHPYPQLAKSGTEKFLEDSTWHTSVTVDTSYIPLRRQ